MDALCWLRAFDDWEFGTLDGFMPARRWAWRDQAAGLKFVFKGLDRQGHPHVHTIDSTEPEWTDHLDPADEVSFIGLRFMETVCRVTFGASGPPVRDQWARGATDPELYWIGKRPDPERGGNPATFKSFLERRSRIKHGPPANRAEVPAALSEVIEAREIISAKYAALTKGNNRTRKTGIYARPDDCWTER